MRSFAWKGQTLDIFGFRQTVAEPHKRVGASPSPLQNFKNVYYLHLKYIYIYIYSL